DDGLGALRRGIVDHPALRVHGTRPRPLDDLAALAAAVSDARRTWSTSQQRYSRLAETLPGVLAGARTARRQRHDAEPGKRPVAPVHAGRAQVAGRGECATAATGGDRAMGTSAQMRHHMLVASSAWHVAAELLRSRHAAESHDYALAAARRVAELMPDMAEA